MHCSNTSHQFLPRIEAEKAITLVTGLDIFGILVIEWVKSNNALETRLVT